MNRQNKNTILQLALPPVSFYNQYEGGRMFGSDILNVFIGLGFIFFLLSLLSSWLQEAIAALFRKRAKYLLHGIQNMLAPSTCPLAGLKLLLEPGDNFVKDFYTHPVIKKLSRPGKLPSYIPAGDFALAVLDLLHSKGKAVRTAKKTTKTPARTSTKKKAASDLDLAAVKKGIQQLENPGTKENLQLLLATVETEANGNQLQGLYKGLEKWFNAVMDRVTGWYKRHMQILALVTGLVLAGIFNADGLQLVKTLWQSTTVREVVTNSASHFLEQEWTSQNNITVKKGWHLSQAVQQQLDQLGLPLGWDVQRLPADKAAWFLKALGLLLTGLAVSQGSSFWYDILKRIVNMRFTGVKPDNHQPDEK